MGQGGVGWIITEQMQLITPPFKAERTDLSRAKPGEAGRNGAGWGRAGLGGVDHNGADAVNNSAFQGGVDAKPIRRASALNTPPVQKAEWSGAEAENNSAPS